jgi:hypothetical protein
VREVGGVAIYLAVLLVLTPATRHGAAVAATPADIWRGKLWLLLTSGAVVEGNLPLSVLGVAALSVAVLLVCDWRVLWAAAGLGHVGSALATYAAIALAAQLEPGRISDDLVHARDYGISAFVAGGLGALAVGAWQRRSEWPMSALWRFVVAASIGSTALMTVHVLDPFWFEHVPAFGIGALVAYLLSAAPAGDYRFGMVSSNRGASSWR